MKLLLLALPLLFGCSSGDDFEATCELNQTRACACPGGEMGAQTCLADRSGWGKCECEAGGDAGKGGGAGATAKGCTIDEDCTTQELPYCVNFDCIAPNALPPGSDCTERYNVCDAKGYCAEPNADGKRYCLAKKAAGKSCESDDMCEHACAGGNCT